MRKAVLPFAVLLFGLSLFVPTLALAWGRDGHEIVARIAEERLNDRAKKAVKELLGEQTLADIASWADEVRGDRQESSPWHYVNIPFEMSGYDAERDGKNGDNVIDKTVDFANAMRDKRMPREHRAEALKYLVHFIGDMHQPLHCCDRNDDRGGNFQLVFFLEKPKAENLHRTWDSLILKHSMGDVKSDEYAKKLSAAITQKQVREWTRGQPVDWANEAHKIAVEIAYSDVPANAPPPKITEKYLETAGPAVDLQLQRAGIRLADVLNRAFR